MEMGVESVLVIVGQLITWGTGIGFLNHHAKKGSKRVVDVHTVALHYYYITWLGLYAGDLYPP